MSTAVHYSVSKQEKSIKMTKSSVNKIKETCIVFATPKPTGKFQKDAKYVTLLIIFSHINFITISNAQHLSLCIKDVFSRIAYFKMFK